MTRQPPQSHYPDAAATVQRIDRLGKPDGVHVVIAAITADQLREAAHLCNQLAEWMQSNAV